MVAAKDRLAHELPEVRLREVGMEVDLGSQDLEEALPFGHVGQDRITGDGDQGADRIDRPPWSG